MKTIAAMARLFRSVSVLKEGTEVMQRTETELAEYNRAQLRAGYDGKGERLKKYRNKFYELRKNRMNPEPGLGNPDYKLTGRYQESFKAAVSGGKLKLYATDPDKIKTEALLKRDGGAEFGLMESSKQDYRRAYLYPGIARRISQITGAKLG